LAAHISREKGKVREREVWGSDINRYVRPDSDRNIRRERYDPVDQPPIVCLLNRDGKIAGKEWILFESIEQNFPLEIPECGNIFLDFSDGDCLRILRI